MTPLYRLLAAALLLTVAACSRAPDAPTAALSPQAFGTPQNDEILDLASYSGGVYAVGNTKGSLYAASKGNTDVFATKIGSDKRTVWSRQFGTPGDDGVRKVATDAGGNVYVFGNTAGNLARANRGGTDFFLRKYGGAGNVVWTLQFGLETNDTPLDLVTTSNSVYVLGQSAGKGFFVYRYNFNGGTWWKRQIRVPPGDAPGYPLLSLDSAGNVFVAKEVDGVIDPDFGQTEDIRLYKFSGAGALLWTDVYDFAQEESVAQVVASGTDVYVKSTRFDVPDDDDREAIFSVSGSGDLRWQAETGVFRTYDSVFGGSSTFFVDGSGVYTDKVTTFTPPNQPEIWSSERTLIKRRLDGSVVWERDFSAFGTTTAIAERGSGEVYVGGYTGSASDPAVPSNALLTRLSATTGATVWSR